MRFLDLWLVLQNPLIKWSPLSEITWFIPHPYSHPESLREREPETFKMVLGDTIPLGLERRTGKSSANSFIFCFTRDDYECLFRKKILNPTDRTLNQIHLQPNFVLNFTSLFLQMPPATQYFPSWEILQVGITQHCTSTANGVAQPRTSWRSWCR